MAADRQRRLVAFEGHQCIAAGEIQEVVRKVKEAIDRGMESMVLIFDAVTSDPVEIDFRGTMEDVLARIRREHTFATGEPVAHPSPEAGSGDENASSGNASAGDATTGDASTVSGGGDDEGPRGPGRPKLGVIAREVTLLPRHWEWLAKQPGGASSTLRKLVEKARKEGRGQDAKRAAQDAAYRFMNAMAGNLPDFEEATRALFAGDRARFHALTADWPADIRDHVRTLAEEAFASDA